MITKLFLLLAGATLLYHGTRSSAPSLSLAEKAWGKLLDVKCFE